MLGNFLVHQRLRDKRLVLLVVAQLPEADHIDDHVAAKLHAVVKRDAAHQQHRFGIVGVDMKHRCLDHFCDVGAIKRRTRVAGIRGGEAHLVVDDDMHRATGLEAARLRQRECFHHHALPCERGIAVNQHRQHFLAVVIVAPMLARSDRAFDDRVDDFQMRGIEGEREMHTATFGLDVG